MPHINNRESETLEFKSSLFFQAGIHEPSQDQVEKTITRVIASFMNQKGGTLYIGVDDNGYPVKGVDEEFIYLNRFTPYEEDNRHDREDRNLKGPCTTDYAGPDIPRNAGNYTLNRN